MFGFSKSSGLRRGRPATNLSVPVRSRFGKLIAGLLATSLVATMGVGATLLAAPAAQAAPIGSIGITAAVSDHVGVTSMGGTTTSGNAWDNCVSYSPADTGTGYTQWGQSGTRYRSTNFVGSGNEARTAHGRGGNNCTSGDSVVISGNSGQSAVGIAPAVAQTVNDGVPFSVGRVTHYNNPVTVSTDFFTGNIKFKLTGFDSQPTLNFPFQMWETPNSSTNCPTGHWLGNDNCQDEIKFSSQISDQTLTKDGLTYRLVVNGFIPSTSSTCPLTISQNAPVNDFWTNEGAVTNACVYASVIQVRMLTVNKTITGAGSPTNKAFAFTSDGSLAGSAWANGAATVTPSALNTATQVFKKELLRADTVKITETPSTDSRWAVTGMSCTEIGVNGNPQPLAGVTAANGVITLTNIGAPPNTTKPDITCNFTNSYTAGSLKISKVLDDASNGFNGPASFKYVGTYNCGTGYSGTFSIAAGSSQTFPGIPVGSTCVVSETAPTGNLKDSSYQWAPATYAPSGSVTIANGATSEVTITNKIVQNKGVFTVQKIVADAAGSSAGYQGGGARIFPVSYTCTLAGVTSAPKTLNATTTGAVSSEAIPTGSVCSLSENLTALPGDFGNDPSYEWVGTSGVFAPASPITIGTASAPVNVTLTNTFKRNLGSLVIAKVVNDPQNGYIAGASMTFRGTYSCNGGAAIPFSVATARNFVVGGLPVGTSCTVTETAPTGGLSNSSFQWSAASYAPANATVSIPKTGTGLVTITNTVVQNSGKFSVTKKVQGPAGDNGYTGASTRPFTVGYSCTLNNAQPINGTLTVTTAQAATSGNIPTGYSCVLTESALSTAPGDFLNNDTSYEWLQATAGSFTPSNTIIIGNGTTVGVELTNKYIRQLGSLTLAKTVSGAGYTGGSAENFTVNYNCGGSYAGVVKLANGASKTITGLPANSICSVSEVTPSGNLDSAHKWGTPNWDVAGNKVTIVKNATVTATVTNPTVAIFGTVSVTKALTGGGVKAGATFPITVNCASANYSKTFTLAVGQSETTIDLPVGTDCTITEGTRPADQFVDDSYAWGTLPAAQTVRIASENQNVAVTVTNTTTRVYGSLRVVKTLTDPDGVYAGAPNNNAPFTGTWSCTYGTQSSGQGSWSVAAGGSSVVSSQILLGSRCTVVENALTSKPSTDTSYSWLPPVLSPSDGVVVLSDAAKLGVVTVQNGIVRSTGTFTVAKAVSGPAAGYSADAKFPFTWVCTGTDIGWSGANGTFELSSQTIWSGPTQAIPAGASCSVTEGANPAASPSYTWDGVTFTAIGASVTQTGRTASFKIPAAAAGSTPTPVNVSATNTISQKFGTVTVTKNVGAGYDGNLKFNITLDCGTAGTFPLQIAGGGSANATVPLDSKCTVTEASPSGGLIDGSYAWDGVVIAPTQFTVTQTQTPISVTVTNKTKRVYGSLDVAKILKDADGVVDLDRQYGGSWSCVYGTDAPVTGTFSIKAGATSAAFGGILVGSKCTVSESALSAPSSDPSYVWMTPVYSDAVEIAAVGTAHLSVTNQVKRNTGSILVTKKLTGATAGLLPNQQFTIVYTCSAANVPGAMTGSKAVSVGVETILLDNVPFGWECTIAENTPTADQLKDASYSWGAVEISTPKVVLSTSNNPAKVSVSNDITRNYGAVALEKVLLGAGGVVDPARNYSGNYSCSYDGAVIKSGTWTAKAGESAVVLATGLPVSTKCTATENALTAPSLDPSYSWVNPVITTASVTSGETSAIKVTNEFKRNFGSLSVTKTLTGSASELAGYTGGTAKNFTINYSCVVPNHPEITALTGSVTVAAGQTQQLAPTAPAGWSCSITESTPSSTWLKDSSFAWGPAVITPSKVTVPLNDTAEVDVKNPITRVYGSVDIKKVVVGPDNAVASDRVYTGTWTCIYGTEPPVTGKWSITAQSSATELSNKVLLNSNCTLTEDTLSAPVPSDPSYQWVSQVGTPDTVGLAKPAHLVMTNTYVRDTAAFTVTKRVDGDGYTGGSAKVFAISYDCGVGFIGSLNLAKDGTETITGIPSQRECTISEDAPQGNLEPAYKWLDPSWSSNVKDGKFTVTKATPTAVVVTNHTEKIFGKVSVTKVLAGVGGVVEGKKFSVNIDCSDGYKASIEVQAGLAPVPSGNIAVGSTCSVVEAPATGGLVDDSYGWATPPAAQQVTVTAENQVVPVTITNTTERRYGTLSIAKVLNDPDSVYPGGNFSGTWTCSYGQGANAVTVNGDWSVAAGQAATSVGEPILLGSSCNVVENQLPEHPTADTSYQWGASYKPGSNVVLSLENQHPSVTVTNTITRLTGAFAVSKTVSGTGAAAGLVPGSKFTFSYSCRGTGWVGSSGTFTLEAGGAGFNSTGAIPAGATCTVTEGANPATSGPSYTWDGVSYTVTSAANTPVQGQREVTFTIPAPKDGVAQTVKVVADNAISQKFGSVDVKKTLSGATAGYVAGKTFEITLNCENLSPITLQMTATSGSNQKSATLPLGSKCTVAENNVGTDGLKDSSFAWNGVKITPSSFEVTSSTTPISVSVVNDIKRVTATIDITKKLVGGEGVIDPERTFTGSWSCVYPGDSAVTGKWSLQAGETWTPDAAILLNSKCTVSEDELTAPSPDPSYRWIAPVLEGTSVLEAGTTAHMTVTNNVVRDVGSINVTKAVTGDVGGYVGGAEPVFSIGYECQVAGVKDSLTGQVLVGNGETAVLSEQIPFGWKCAIAEAKPVGHLADDSFVWGTPVLSATEVTLTKDQAAVKVTVQNPIKRAYGSLEIAKQVSGPGAEGVADTTQFTGSVSCTYGSDEAVVSKWTATTKTAAKVEGILVGSKCVVTEDSPENGPSSSDPSMRWLPAKLPSDITVMAAPEVTKAIVENPTEQVLGAFAIAKTVTGAREGVSGNADYSFTWKCTPVGGGDPLSGTAAVRDGGLWQLPESVKIPRGSSCSVTELLDKRPVTVDSSFTWAPVQFTTDTAEGKQEGAEVTFTIPKEATTVLVTADNPVERQLGAFSVSKSSNPVSGTKVKVGQKITYTLTANNSSEFPVRDVVLTDDLRSVFAASNLEGSFRTSVGTTIVKDQVLEWTIGTLGPGAKQTLSYTVVIKAGSENATLTNIVLGNGEVPPTSCAAAVPMARTASLTAASVKAEAPCGTTHTVEKISVVVPPVVPPKQSLPETGVTGLWILGLGAILMSGGAMMIMTNRRRGRLES